MNLTALAIDRRRVTWVAVVLLVVAGILAFRRLPQSQDPGFTVRTALIQTALPGAGPERVEQLVTNPIEERIEEIAELDYVTSSSSQGLSVIYVTLKDEVTDPQPVFDRMRRKVEAARAELPRGVMGPVIDDEFGDVFGILLGVSATPGFTDAELEAAAEQLRDALLRLPEAAKVRLHGVQERRIYVEFDNASLADLAISPTQLVSILQTRNIVDPGGVVTAGPSQIALEPTGAFGSVEELRETGVPLPGGRGEVLQLGDIATVYEGLIEPPQPRARVNGERAIVVAVSLREGGNIAALGEDVLEVVERIERSWPIGLEIDRVHFQPDHVADDVSSFLGNLVQGVIIVMATMMIFLGLRTGMVMASLIPLSMVATFVMMATFDVGIDAVSLAALVIALGMLVDNAIVLVEAFLVGMTEGKGARDAAIAAASELAIPLLVSTLTTAAAFLPIYLAESQTGEYTAPLFLVVTMALLASWALSLTVIPLFCVQFLAKGQLPPVPFDTPAYAAYRRILVGALDHPVAVLSASTAALVGALALSGLIERTFFPPSDKPIFTVEIEGAPGSTLEQTEQIVRDLEAWIAQAAIDEVASYASFIGVGPPRFQLTFRPHPPDDGYALLLVNAASRDLVDDLLPRFEAYLHGAHPDVQASIKPLTLGPPAGWPVAVRISAPTREQLFRAADQVRAHLASIPGARNIGDDWGMRTAKLDVRIDPARARLAGITHADIALSLQTALTGIEATEFRAGDEITPVILRARAEDRGVIGRLDGLNMFVQRTGQPVPLEQVADVQLTFQNGEILRRNLAQTMEIHAELEPGASASAVSDALVSWLGEVSADWPEGTRWEISGEAEANARSRRSIRSGIPVAAIAIVMLLVLQFNSLRNTFINLAVLPFGYIGVVIGLFATGATSGFMTLLGVVSLYGIVVNNANVLLDRIEIERKELGRAPREAIVEACQRRLRPVFLTTATTVGGLVPLWIGGGPMFRPMAIALIFGLLFGTLLTLVLVPSLYALLYRVPTTAERP